MLRFLDQVNTIVGMLLFLAYLYQVFYTLYGLAFCRRDRRKAARQTPAKPSRRYAALICARNEESVIGELIDPSPSACARTWRPVRSLGKGQASQ